jgi:hypothetical protein
MENGRNLGKIGGIFATLFDDLRYGSGLYSNEKVSVKFRSFSPFDKETEQKNIPTVTLSRFVTAAVTAQCVVHQQSAAVGDSVTAFSTSFHIIY